MNGFWNREIPPRLLRRAAVAALLLGVLFAGGGLWVVRELARDLPSPSVLLDTTPPRKTLVFAANGDTIREYFLQNRTIVPLERIPARLRQAVVATEDRRFYRHYGLDPRRLVKVILVNLTSRSRPGASTITMQLARNLTRKRGQRYLTSEKTIRRKLKEMLLALQLEQTYSKDEILEMYLNQIYLGGGAYGVEAASRTYFGKDVWDLDDAEATLLAGLIQLPEAYSPFRHLDRAYRRRKAVLASMVAVGYLTPEQARAIDRQPVRVVAPGKKGETVDAGFAAYFAEEVRRWVEERYGYDGLYNDGLQITTTLVPDYQRWLEEASERHLERMEAENHYPMTKARYDSLMAAGHRPEKVEYLLSASVVLDVRTGAVLALVGGRDYRDSQFDLATQAQRQPGSIFKPVIYLTALQHGYTACSILMDTPVVIETGGGLWRPRNFNNRFMGPITLRYGLSHSKNVVTAKLINDFGVAPVLENARRLGITSNLPPVKSLALGAGEVNLLEMVSAYSTFPNHGVRAEPYFVSRVESADGHILYESRLQQHEVLDPATAWLMCDLMHSTLTEGTARSAVRYGFRKTAGGKTGTYNEYTDAWFIGYTPSLVAGVWVGFDQKVSMGRRGTGAHMALPIWATFMARATDGQPDEPFVRPPGIVEKLICLRSGKLATARCDSTRQEVFLADNFPQEPCDLHGGPLQDLDGYRKDFRSLDRDPGR